MPGLVVLCALLLTACAGKTPSPRTSTAAPPPTAVPTVPGEAKIKYGEALQSVKAGHLPEAEALLVELTRRYPTLAGPHANLGLLHLRAGRLGQAEESLRQAIRLKPDEPRFYNHLGIALRQAGRFDAARQAYEKALALAPDYGDAHLNLGILCDLYLLEYGAAKRHYLRAKALLDDPQQVAGWLADLERRAQVNQ